MTPMHLARLLRTCLPALVLSAMACDTTAPVIENDRLVALSASAEIRSDTVFFRLSARNEADTAVDLTWGACEPALGAMLSVHAPVIGSNSLRWDEVVWRRQGACYPVGYGTRILPGDDWSLAGRVAVRSILGDSLPGGQYRLIVTPAFVEDIPRSPLDVGIFILER